MLAKGLLYYLHRSVYLSNMLGFSTITQARLLHLSCNRASLCVKERKEIRVKLVRGGEEAYAVYPKSKADLKAQGVEASWQCQECYT